MADYRDIGHVEGGAATAVAVASPNGQVYKATHDGKGNRLAYMYRSFISFSFGGVQIEDLGLIATTSDRLSRQLSAGFEDLVTDYDVIDGQYYWGTRYTTNKLDLTLSTDGMTEKQLEEFKRLFSGGNVQELILAEHPNRAINARVAEPPVMSVYPFEGQLTGNIVRQSYTTGSTLYRGDITLSLITDEPYWHAVNDIILDNAINANFQRVEALTDPDTIKTILEDNIAYYRMLDEYTYVGPGLYSKESTTMIPSKDLAQNALSYLYYCGTAPATTEIAFTFTPHFNSTKNHSIPEYFSMTNALVGTAIVGHTYIGNTRNSNSTAKISAFYIMEPRNKTYESIWNARNPHVHYNYIQIGSNQFRFTNPDIFSAYNSALDVMRQFSNGGSLAEILVAIRNNVTEYHTRAWAVAVINYLGSSNFVDSEGTGLIASYSGMTLQYAFNKLMWMYLVDSNGKPKEATVSFNSKDGTATGVFQVRQISVPAWNATTVKAKDDMFSYFYQQSHDITVTENIGNMVYDKYFILDDVTRPDESGMINANECLKVYTDFIDGLVDLQINYRNMYL